MIQNAKSTACVWRMRLCAVHDFITRLGFILAAICLAVIVSSYCYEVVARYFFAAPTHWVGSLVAYLLCVSIFLTLPEITREKMHIFISVVPDMLSRRNGTALIRMGRLVGVIACFLGAWFSADASYTQFIRGLYTVNEWDVPKWMVSIFIPYGLLSSGLYFLRQVGSNEPYIAAGSETS